MIFWHWEFLKIISQKMLFFIKIHHVFEYRQIISLFQIDIPSDVTVSIRQHTKITIKDKKNIKHGGNDHGGDVKR